MNGIDAHATRRPHALAELRRGSWQLSCCIALTGLGPWIAAGCDPGQEDRPDPLASLPDASTAPSWTRCPPSGTGPDQDLHAAALSALAPTSPTTPGPCAFGGCHNEAAAKAKFKISASTVDLRALLVDVPACEAPSLALVDGRGGDDALTRSWLWQKLTAPASADGALLALASWGDASPCAAQAGAGTPYGARMPQGIGSLLLSDERLRAVQQWICAGAPDPRGLP